MSTTKLAKMYISLECIKFIIIREKNFARAKRAPRTNYIFPASGCVGFGVDGGLAGEVSRGGEQWRFAGEVCRGSSGERCEDQAGVAF